MLGLILIVFLLGQNITAFRIGGRAGCQISVNGDLGEPQPLLLKPNRSSTDAFYLPVDTSGTIKFNKNQNIDLACPGNNLVLNGQNLTTNIERAICVSDDTFQIDKKNYKFKTITCSNHTYHTARYTGKNCANSNINKEIEIGFIVEKQFLHHITICFDTIKQIALYTIFNMTSAIGGYQSKYPRPYFIEGSFYNMLGGVDILYNRTIQRATVNELLGLPVNSKKYVQDGNDYFLARGHLTAKADFVFGAQHRLTFYYVNAAPQWQTFNGGNWNVLEQNVRRYSATKKVDLEVYTGTHEISTLPHEITGKDTELYFYTKEIGKHSLPIPKYYWKVVYEPKTKAGVAFVGLNNPYQKDVSKSVICDDVSDKISWLSWNKTNLVLGYSYACTVDNFRKAVPYLPKLDVKSLLT